MGLDGNGLWTEDGGRRTEESTLRRGQCPKLSYVAKASRFGFGFGVASLLDLQINLFNSHSTWTPQREIFYNADTRWAPTQRGVKVRNTERGREGKEGN